MKKLPVWRTFTASTKFFLLNVATIGRLTWLPNACIAALLVAMIYGIQSDFCCRNGIEINPLKLSLVYVTAIPLQLIAVSAMAVSIHRLVLFDERCPSHYLVFSFGKTEALHAGMMLAVWLIWLGFILIPLGVAIAILWEGDFSSFIRTFTLPEDGDAPRQRNATLMFMTTTFMVTGFVSYYILLRLSLWSPLVVAQHRLSLMEAWRLTSGNALRLLGYFGLTLVFTYLISIPAILLPIAGGAALFDMSDPAQLGRPRILPFILFCTLAIPFYVIVFGVFCTAASFAYKALSEPLSKPSTSAPR